MIEGVVCGSKNHLFIRLHKNDLGAYPEPVIVACPSRGHRSGLGYQHSSSIG